MDPYRDFLLTTLDIIELQQDKQQWITNFLKHAQEQAFLKLLHTLPEEKQTELMQHMQSPQNGETPEDILQRYFTPLDCSIALQEEVLEEYKEFVQNTINTLSPEKQKQLQEYILPMVNSAT